MPTFTIDDENNITLVDSAELAASSGHSTSFDSQALLLMISRLDLRKAWWTRM